MFIIVKTVIKILVSLLNMKEEIGENVIIAGLKTFIEKQRNRGINDKESKL